MTLTIHTLIERKRDCGYRKPGGTYLRSDGLAEAHGRLPIPLDACPTCHASSTPTRARNGTVLAVRKDCRGNCQCSRCPLGGLIGRPPSGPAVGWSIQLTARSKSALTGGPKSWLPV
jgi:hypothetical protein